MANPMSHPFTHSASRRLSSSSTQLPAALHLAGDQRFATTQETSKKQPPPEDSMELPAKSTLPPLGSALPRPNLLGALTPSASPASCTLAAAVTALDELHCCIEGTQGRCLVSPCLDRRVDRKKMELVHF